MDKDSKGRLACYPQRTFYSLSDDLSIKNHRVTMTGPFLIRKSKDPCFRCLCCSQASFCHCTSSTVTSVGYSPLYAPGTLWGASTPDKLPAIHCLPTFSGKGSAILGPDWAQRISEEFPPQFSLKPRMVSHGRLPAKLASYRYSLEESFHFHMRATPIYAAHGLKTNYVKVQ